jgi:hypothetical protein
MQVATLIRPELGVAIRLAGVGADRLAHAEENRTGSVVRLFDHHCCVSRALAAYSFHVFHISSLGQPRKEDRHGVRSP